MKKIYSFLLLLVLSSLIMACGKEKSGPIRAEFFANVYKGTAVYAKDYPNEFDGYIEFESSDFEKGYFYAKVGDAVVEGPFEGGKEGQKDGTAIFIYKIKLEDGETTALCSFNDSNTGGKTVTWMFSSNTDLAYNFNLEVE